MAGESLPSFREYAISNYSISPSISPDAPDAVITSSDSKITISVSGAKYFSFIVFLSVLSGYQLPAGEVTTSVYSVMILPLAARYIT